MGKEAGGIVRGLVLALAVATVSCEPTQKSEQKDLPKSNQVTSATAVALPLVFEANHGQTDKRVGFVVRRPGYTLFLTPDEAVLRLAGPATPSKSGPRGQRKRPAIDRQGPHTLRMKVLGARSGVRPIGVDQQRGKVNYFHGNDPTKWLTGIPTYTRVRYPDVLSGIDLVFYGDNGRLRYDFVVAPGADPGAIRLKFAGSGRLEIDQKGNLILDTRAGLIVHTAPSLYQSVDGRRIPVGGGFVLRGSTEVGFKVDTWNRAVPLVIDPGIVFGTYFGGTAGEICGVAPADARMGMSVNDQDHVFVTGCTYSVDFPDTDQPAGDIQHPGTQEVFVFRIDMAPDNSATLGYSTYFGGSGGDGGTDVEALSSGVAFVTGFASENFPIVGNIPFQPAFGSPGEYRAFIAKLDASGVITQSTYLGTSSNIFADALAVDTVAGAGYGVGVYVAGTIFDGGLLEPEADGLPIVGAFQGAPFQSQYAGGDSDGFVAKLNLGLSQTNYFTYLGGKSNDRATDITVRDGIAFVTGHTASFDFPTKNAVQATPGMVFDDPDCAPAGFTPTRCFDAFYVRVNRTGNDIDYGTFFGGSGREKGRSIAIDGNGKVFIAGVGNSDQLSLGDEVFIAGLVDDTTPWDPDYLGGSGDDGSIGLAIAVGADNRVHLTGDTFSDDMDQILGLVSPTPYGGFWDAFYLQHGPPASDFHYIGGPGADMGEAIAVNAAGAVYIAGWTLSNDLIFPGESLPGHAAYLGDTEIFVVKIGAPPEPAPNLTLSKEDTPDPVTTGQDVVYDLIVHNSANATASATNVSVHDVLPAGVTLQAIDLEGTPQTLAVDADACSLVVVPPSTETVECALGDLPPGQGRLIAITATPAPGEHCNSARVFADNLDSSIVIEQQECTTVVTASGCSALTGLPVGPLEEGDLPVGDVVYRPLNSDGLWRTTDFYPPSAQPWAVAGGDGESELAVSTGIEVELPFPARQMRLRYIKANPQDMIVTGFGPDGAMTEASTTGGESRNALYRYMNWPPTTRLHITGGQGEILLLEVCYAQYVDPSAVGAVFYTYQ